MPPSVRRLQSSRHPLPALDQPRGRAARVAGVLAALGLALWAAAPAGAASDPVCGADAGTGEPVSGTYQLQSGAPTTVELGRGSTGSLDMTVTVEGCHLPIAVAPEGYTERFLSGSQQFPLDQITVTRMRVEKHRIVISLDVTRGGAPPGTYRGYLDVDNSEAFGNALTIPVTITVAERPWWKVLAPALLVAFLGGMALLWLQSGGTGNAPLPFGEWLKRPRTWVALGFGVAGAVAVWWKQYLDASTWTFSQFPSLIPVMVVAFTGAAAVAAGAASAATAAKQAKENRAADPQPVVAKQDAVAETRPPPKPEG